MNHCKPNHGPSRPNPCAGLQLPLPRGAHWFSHSVLGATRVNQARLAGGTADSGAVHLVQTALRYWGAERKKERRLLMPVHGPDGVFGNETKAAVVAFQSENADGAGMPLVKDSVVGFKTIGALDAMVRQDDPEAPTNKAFETVTVDFVLFPDGERKDMIDRCIEKANKLYAQARIKVLRGTTVLQHEAGPAACTIFDKNIKTAHERDPKLGGWCRSKLMRDSVNKGDTDEIARLMAFRPGSTDRVTVYFTTSFPDATMTNTGFAMTKAYGHKAFGIVIAKWATTDAADTFWHELGHCLINAKFGEIVDGKHDDHDHDFMHRPFVKSYKIPPVLAQRLRETARTVLK
ncbi:MAG: hypothetical protein AAF318_10140 [Pseudomonadota bacterium]